MPARSQPGGPTSLPFPADHNIVAPHWLPDGFGHPEGGRRKQMRTENVKAFGADAGPTTAGRGRPVHRVARASAGGGGRQDRAPTGAWPVLRPASRDHLRYARSPSRIHGPRSLVAGWPALGRQSLKPSPPRAIVSRTNYSPRQWIWTSLSLTGSTRWRETVGCHLGRSHLLGCSTTRLPRALGLTQGIRDPGNSASARRSGRTPYMAAKRGWRRSMMFSARLITPTSPRKWR